MTTAASPKMTLARALEIGAENLTEEQLDELRANKDVVLREIDERMKAASNRRAATPAARPKMTLTRLLELGGPENLTPEQQVDLFANRDSIMRELVVRVAISQGIELPEMDSLLEEVDLNPGEEVYRLRVKALSLHRDAAKLLDEADGIEFADKLRAAAEKLDAPREAAAKGVLDLEAALTAAITETRRAEDAVREADDEHRKVADEESRAQRTHAPAAEQTANLIKLRAATDVLTRLRAAAEGARASQVEVARRLDEARKHLVVCEQACEAARAQIENPPPTPMSLDTAQLDGIRRFQHGERLDDIARADVRWRVKGLCRQLGIDKAIQKQAREELVKELHERQLGRILPPQGHQTRPSNPAGQGLAMIQTPGGSIVAMKPNG